MIGRPFLDRRAFLRGAGGALVALPLLDLFLDGNGSALADGRPLPVRFGTWTWGCGMQPSRWVPRSVGADYDLPPELAGLGGLTRKVTVLSGFSVHTDGRQNKPHTTGYAALRTGTVPAGNAVFDAPTLDVLIADAVGAGTRFTSLEATATGNPLHSYSARSNAVINAPATTPLELYRRLFADGFQDPNSDGFTPDPRILVRNSVLSAIKEERADFIRGLGAADRARADQYFTSVRQLEQQLELQLQKPDKRPACKAPAEVPETPMGTEVETLGRNHDLMAQLLAMALACNQTRVFNMVFVDFVSTLRKRGTSSTLHSITHEESLDPALGYQVQVSWFVEQAMNRWAAFLGILDGIPEGTGTLLDNCIVLAHSDVSYAQVHSLDGIPMMLAGSGGGRLRPGLHVAGGGDAVTRVGLTLQQAMGVAVERWGTGSMQTARPVGDILA